MNFGSLQIVTAWRLTRDGIMCQGIVMDGQDGVRLVVIEDQQIVEWIRFGRIFDLRQHLARAFRTRTQEGWVPVPARSDAAHLTTPMPPGRPLRRRGSGRAGLLPIAD